ncbi:MAG: hypothetical protein ACP5UV_01580 [Thermoplasmata archaeon]
MLISFRKNFFVLAPPYAVTAYLVTMDPKGKYSRAENIALSYIIVIITTEILHFLLGFSYIPLIINVLIVSIFISYSKYSHPPAIALTIFSYIIHGTVPFVIASVSVLAMIIIFRLLLNVLEKFDAA